MHTLEFSQGVLAWRWKWGEGLTAFFTVAKRRREGK